MKYVADSSAWIELFIDSEGGKKFAKIIKDKENKIITCDATFAEVFTWATKRHFDVGKLFGFIRTHSEIFEVYTNVWIEAADLKDKRRKKVKKFSLIDALILRIQQLTGAKLITKDHDFKGLKNVIIL